LNLEPRTLNAGTGRLPVATVQRLERLLGGDPVTEDQVLRFIGSPQYMAKNLFYLPPKVAAAICRRPSDFIRAAQQHCQPELALVSSDIVTL
jgi:hypothetical protein